VAGVFINIEYRKHSNGSGNMKYKLAFLISTIAVMMLQACSGFHQELNLSSGVQYLGEDKKMITELEKLKVDLQHSSEINIETTNKKLILIEPEHIKNISKDEVELALEKGFYVFFINTSNDKIIQEKYLNSKAYELNKDRKKWVEQIFYADNGLATLHISTDGTISDNLLNWLKTMDDSKRR
jgi:hypothetical protein